MRDMQSKHRRTVDACGWAPIELVAGNLFWIQQGTEPQVSIICEHEAIPALIKALTELHETRP